MGVKIGGDAGKIGKNTHLLVMLRVRLSQKIGLLDLTNHIRFKKENDEKQRTRSVRNYWGMRLILNKLYINYRHTHVDLIGVFVASGQKVLKPQVFVFQG